MSLSLVKPEGTRSFNEERRDLIESLTIQDILTVEYENISTDTNRDKKVKKQQDIIDQAAEMIAKLMIEHVNAPKLLRAVAVRRRQLQKRLSLIDNRKSVDRLVKLQAKVSTLQKGQELVSHLTKGPEQGD